MRIASVAPYCKCAGLTSWLRYLVGATRGDLGWHCWFNRAQASPYTEMSDLCHVDVGTNSEFGDALKLWKPDIIVCAYRGSHYEVAYKHRADYGTPVVGVLHTRPSVYEKMRPLLAQTDALVCPSETVAQEYAGWDGMERARTIPHGIMPPPDALSGYDFRSMYDLPRDSYLVGWVGRLDLEKGWDELLDIVEQMRGSRHHFIIAGVGKRPGMAKVAMAAKSYSNVSWLGAVPLNSMPSFYAGLDAGLSTSPYESFGLAVCEMAWHELDIVARDGGAVGEVLDGGSAWLYSGTSEAIDCLDALADGEGPPGSDSRAAVEGKGYDAHRMGREYVELFEDLM